VAGGGAGWQSLSTLLISQSDHRPNPRGSRRKALPGRRSTCYSGTPQDCNNSPSVLRPGLATFRLVLFGNIVIDCPKDFSFRFVLDFSVLRVWLFVCVRNANFFSLSLVSSSLLLAMSFVLLLLMGVLLLVLVFMLFMLFIVMFSNLYRCFGCTYQKLPHCIFSELFDYVSYGIRF